MNYDRVDNNIELKTLYIPKSPISRSDTSSIRLELVISFVFMKRVK